jgi:spore maturation protein B
MFAAVCAFLSVWALPLVLLLIPLAGFLRRVRIYEAFVEGAAEGFQTAVRIMPFLVAMLVAVGVFRASGALDDCVAVLQPMLSFAGVPPELVPLAIMRPLSGTGALGLTTELLASEGPDSLIGRMASTILGSTDTTFYILTVYFAPSVSATRDTPSPSAWSAISRVSSRRSYVCRLLFGV